MPVEIPVRKSLTGDRQDVITCLTFALCGMLAIALWCVSNRDLRRPCWSDESGFVTEADISLVCR